MGRSRTVTSADAGRDVHASRTESTTTTTTAVVGPETRHLHIFEGTEFINFERTQEFLSDPAGAVSGWSRSTTGSVIRFCALAAGMPGLTLTGSGAEVRYSNPRQRVEWVLHFSGDRSVFKTALETPNIGVIYNGHARYGRGPCFGPYGSPSSGNRGEFWSDGTGPTDGIFRMGWDWLSVPASEVTDHGYHTDLVLQATAIDAAKSDPDLRNHFRRLSSRGKAVEELSPDVTSWVQNAHGTDRVRHYSSPGEDGQPADHVVLPAGAAGLRSTTVACRFFAHLGCSTQAHNARVFRDVIGRPSGDARQTVWTTGLSKVWGYWLFLHHFLTYGEVVAGQPWRPQLRYAVRRASADLQTARSGWQLANGE